MARIKTSALITEIAGSVGGSTFQRTKSGLILKNKPKGFHGNTVNRSVRTNLMHSLQHEWISLTDRHRRTWQIMSVYAKIPQKNNPDKYLSGHQMYLKYNYYRLLTGLSIENSCKFSFSAVSKIIINVEFAVGIFSVTASRNFDPTKEFLVFMATYPLSSSINNPGSRYRYVATVCGVSNLVDIRATYSSVFGRVPVVGEYLCFKYRLVDKIGLYVLPWQYGSTTLS